MQTKFFSLVLASAVAAAAAFTPTTASAETSTLNVPFSFAVGNKICPAGTYFIRHDPSGARLQLKSEDASKTFNWMAIPSAANGTRVVLKFDEVGGTHVLQSVQYGTLATPRLDKKLKIFDEAQTRIVTGQ